MVGDILHSSFAIVNENIYDGFACCVVGTSFDTSGTEIIESGDKKEIRILIRVPKDYVKDHSMFDIYFDVEGKVYNTLFKK